MKIFLCLGLLLSAIVLPNPMSTNAGDEFWNKPSKEWNEKETRHFLAESPWATTVTLRHTVLKQERRKFGTMSDVAGEGEGVSDPEVVYTVYVRTAQPVREAIVRTAQFEEKYEGMDKESRKAFDLKWQKFLAAQPTDKIIFQVSYRANTADVDRQLANYWQNQTVETLSTNGAAMTGPDGLRRTPIAFWTARGAGREFQIAFARPEQTGRDSGALSVEITHPAVTGEPSTRIFAKFLLKDMVYRGAITY